MTKMKRRTKTRRRKKKRTGINCAGALADAMAMKSTPGITRFALAASVLVSLCLAAFVCVAQVQPPVVAPPGQPTTRSIVGTVLSSSGAPVPGARVLLKNGKTLQVRSFIALDGGKYHFYGLSSDINYELRAQANGMTSKTKNISVFDSHKLIHVDLKLTKKADFRS